MNAPRPIRIVDWPCIALLGVCAVLLACLLVAVVVALFTSPAPDTTPVTVQLGETVLECTWYEDRANHMKSLSC